MVEKVFQIQNRSIEEFDFYASISHDNSKSTYLTKMDKLYGFKQCSKSATWSGKTFHPIFGQSHK